MPPRARGNAPGCSQAGCAIPVGPFATWSSIRSRRPSSPVTCTPSSGSAAVIVASFEDPLVNRAYRELALHYGFLISPCLPRRPEHKGGVEGDIKYVKRNFLPLFREAEKERGRDTPDAGELGETGRQVHHQAARGGLTPRDALRHAEFLDMLLTDEAERRDFEQLGRRLTKSGLAPDKTRAPTLRELATCRLVQRSARATQLRRSGTRLDPRRSRRRYLPAPAAPSRHRSASCPGRFRVSPLCPSTSSRICMR